jgi:hypothetical protein
MTGLTDEQVDALCAAPEVVEAFDTVGRPFSPGLHASVEIALVALRTNQTQAVIAEQFSTSQPTVSRRCTALRARITRALERFVPDPVEVTRGDTILVDGTLVATSDWADQENNRMFSGKHHRCGFNVQLAATVAGALIAIGLPIHGSRHDAHAWQVSGLAERLTGFDIIADLGYVGIAGMTTGTRRQPGAELTDGQRTLNASLSGIRAAIERAIAHLKNWKVLKTGYRGPLDRFADVLRTVTALHFYKQATDPTPDDM